MPRDNTRTPLNTVNTVNTEKMFLFLSDQMEFRTSCIARVALSVFIMQLKFKTLDI